MELFRAATAGIGVAELDLPVPSCPGWTVSDVLTHVADNHAAVLAHSGIEQTSADLFEVYDEHLSRRPRALVDALDLTLHAWDVARARGMSADLDDVTLDFLTAFAVDAGEQLYVDGEFEMLLIGPEHGRRASVLALYGRDARTAQRTPHPAPGPESGSESVRSVDPVTSFNAHEDD
ncbi:maleylpyruvate isomerase N-terminal domain-containing protein [Nocardioides litoris]|uniref:maleylpyruvate isomerase N-terminal domain-containing protein n=1 Tax=Nocardioides litoris TaxID=1926648 RepID=UPI0014769DC0|nr:maleylpyruvate isomerase N-terminal domain-containing protein [Nocardioides litoris]